MSSAYRRRGGAPSVTQPSVWQRMWSPFWAIPVLAVVVATVAGLFLPQVDGYIQEDVPWWLFGGGPDSARGILSTIATAMISVTGLVFSITMVVLQLAASQYTPRVLGTFLSSRIVQTTLAVFLSSFVFSLTVLRSVRGGNDGFDHAIPQVSVTIATALVIASMGMFLLFIHHITSSIQIGRIVSSIGDATMRAVDKVFPAEEDIDGPDASKNSSDSADSDDDSDRDDPRHLPPWSAPDGTEHTVVTARDRHGVVSSIDYDTLVDLAEKQDVVVQIEVCMGDFVPDGGPIGRVWWIGGGSTSLDAAGDRNGDEEGDAGRDGDGDEGHEGDRGGKLEQRILRAIGLSNEPALDHDVSFGLRQLTDITERGLATGTNDPTTAIQGIQEIHRIFRRLVQRISPSPEITTDDGTVRVVDEPQTVEGLLVRFVPELAFYGAESARLPTTIAHMLDDLLTVARPEYRSLLRKLRAGLPEEPLEERRP